MLKILLIICLLATSGFCYNLGQLRNHIRLLVKDTNSDTTKRRWSDAILNERINIAQDEVIKYTRCLESRITMDTVANTKEYQLPANCVVVERVAYSIYTSTYGVNSSTAGYKRLIYVTIAGKDKDVLSGWEATSASNPTEYYIRGSTIIGLHPTPSSSYAGSNRLQIDYTINASSMTNDTDIPFNGSNQLYNYHSIIMSHVVAYCKYDENDLNSFSLWLQKFNAECEFMRKDILNIPDRYGQQIKFGRND